MAVAVAVSVTTATTVEVAVATLVLVAVAVTVAGARFEGTLAFGLVSLDWWVKNASAIAPRANAVPQAMATGQRSLLPELGAGPIGAGAW
jgi:hypothetical protein